MSEPAVIRFVAELPASEINRQQLLRLASELERGARLSVHQRRKIAEVLQAITTGTSPEKIFKVTTVGAPRLDYKLGWIATDYWLRSELRHRKVAAKVAVDWQQNLNTVQSIKRRLRGIAQSRLERWKANQYPLEACLEGVDSLRQEILTGKSQEPRLCPGV